MRQAALIALFLLGTSPTLARAIGASVDLGSAEWPGGNASGIRAHFAWDESDALSISLSLDKLSIAERSYSNLRVDCGEAKWTDEQLSCLRAILQRAEKGAEPILANVDIVYRFDNETMRIDARNGRLKEGKVDLRITGKDGDWRGRVSTQGAPVTSLKPLIEMLGLWPDGYDEATGTIDVDGEFTVRGGKLISSKLVADSKALSFAGAAIADNADVHLETSVSTKQGVLHIEGLANLNGGAVYYEPGLRIDDYTPGVTLENAGQPATVKWAIRNLPDNNEMRLDHLTLDQPGVVTLALSGNHASDTGSTAPALHAELRILDLRHLYELHLRSHCAHLPSLCGLEFDGMLDVDAAWTGTGINKLVVRFHDVHADDDRKRFRIAALDGDLIFHDGKEALTSELRWQRAGWQRLDFGAGNVAMTSSGRALKVTRWSDVEILGGTFKVDQLELADVGTRDFSVAIQGVLTPIPMEAFSQAMGWPIMSGTLAGVIPGLTYQRGRLELKGDLLLRLFGGNVVVRGLNIENPFGQPQLLTTDVQIRNIDLEQLTGTFAFGKIQGTLEGEVDDLHLQNWRPVAFDGYLQNPESDDRPHRISQKAVDNLSAIGGGVGGALSRGFLRIFQDYSYDRLGLHCRLQNGICAMKGVAPASDGFYIVTRGGLLPPWIDVKGSGNRLPDGRFGIAWNDILLGFKRINSGQMKLQ